MTRQNSERTIGVWSDGKVERWSAAEFERRTSLRYLPRLAFTSERLREELVRRCEAAVALGKVSIRPGLLGKHFHHEMESAFVNDMYIRSSGQQSGLGLFAGKTIGGGDFIGEYTGVVRPCWLFFSDSNDYCFRYPLYHIGPRVFAIDATSCCNETSFINHSNAPNCESVVVLFEGVFHICIRALRAIAKDEEITFDYGAGQKYE